LFGATQTMDLGKENMEQNAKEKNEDDPPPPHVSPNTQRLHLALDDDSSDDDGDDTVLDKQISQESSQYISQVGHLFL
jgi:hypothetical protein